jgi:GNAT superfamily N-acetyltransferase
MHNHVVLIAPDVACMPITTEQTLPLRHSVLWPNMPISHACLPEDENGLHLGAFLPSHDHPIAVISLFIEPAPIGITASHNQHGLESVQVRFRKFACDPEYQGRGIGSTLLRHSISLARSELNCGIFWCDARTSSSDWYRKRGLIPFGEKFFKGTVEYVRMYIDVGVSAPVVRGDSTDALTRG